MAIAILFFFILFLMMGWSRHYGFMTSINDMGHYDQAIWGIINKGFFLNTSLFNTPINKLGFHFDPVLYLFAPLYYLQPTVNWLILAQAIALSFSAWPIYRLACHYAPSGATGVFWGLAYLINPFVLNAASWDFHPLTLAVPWIAGACLAVERQRFLWLLACCLFILLCMEHFGLMVAGFGLLWAIRHREIWKSLALIVLGACHFILVIRYVMPAFSPTGTHVMMSDQLGQLSRYSWLGSSISEIIHSLVQHPLHFLKISFFELDGFIYVFSLIIPFICLPILAPTFLFPAIGDLAANMLSANPMPRAFWAYHSAAVMPLFCAAAIRGSLTILRWRTSLSTEKLAGFVLLISIIFGYILTTLPLPLSLNFWAPRQLFNRQDPQIKGIRKIIGPTASLSAQANIGAHFSQRQEIYSFPNKLGDAEILVLRLESPTTLLISKSVAITGTLASHLHLDPNEYLGLTKQILKKDEYGVIYWQDPWLVFKKGETNKYPKSLAIAKIDYLNDLWNIK